MEHTAVRFIEIGSAVEIKSVKRDWLFGMTDGQWMTVILGLAIALGVVIQARMM